MLNGNWITAVIPALNEACGVAEVVHSLREQRFQGKQLIDHIVVCDNGSCDNTGRAAERAGAHVVLEKERGYGAACLKALDFIALSDQNKPRQNNPGQRNQFKTDIVLFLNADQSEDTNEAIKLLLPISESTSDLVIGIRPSELRQSGALSLPQITGNWLVSKLVSWCWNVKCTDFGPYRAIAYPALQKLNMQDRNYGWTVEMQVKALFNNFRVREIPVLAMVGQTSSRVSGTWRGIFHTAFKMMAWAFSVGAMYRINLYLNKPDRKKSVIFNRHRNFHYRPLVNRGR